MSPLTVTRTLPARRHHRRAPRRRRPRTDPHTEATPAQVVLRRPRQRTLRRDHHTAGLLPDPRRTRNPHHPFHRDRRRHRRPHPGRTRLRLLRKTRHLIAALTDLHTYVPVDVSESALTAAGASLLALHPTLTVHALVADFQQGFALPGTPGPRLLAFLGGTIGNLLPEERATFLRAAHDLLSPGDALLLGTDLVKDEATLVAAYDDPTGVTAEFNKNVLNVINRELEADFDPADFEHVALWNAEQEWIEMRLRAKKELTVKVPALDLAVPFAEGEEIRTEISAKFREEGVRGELGAAGFKMSRWWTDEAERFGVALAVRGG